ASPGSGIPDDRVQRPRRPGHEGRVLGPRDGPYARGERALVAGIEAGSRRPGDDAGARGLVGARGAVDAPGILAARRPGELARRRRGPGAGYAATGHLGAAARRPANRRLGRLHAGYAQRPGADRVVQGVTGAALVAARAGGLGARAGSL